MKEELMNKIIQGILLLLDNAQMEHLLEVLNCALFGYEVKKSDGIEDRDTEQENILIFQTLCIGSTFPKRAYKKDIMRKVVVENDVEMNAAFLGEGNGRIICIWLGFIFNLRMKLALNWGRTKGIICLQ